MAASSSVNKISRLARRAGRFFLLPQSGLPAGIIGFSLRCGRPSHLRIGVARFFCAPQDCFPTQAQTCSPRAVGGFSFARGRTSGMLSHAGAFLFHTARRRFPRRFFPAVNAADPRLSLTPHACAPHRLPFKTACAPLKRRDRYRFPLIHANFPASRSFIAIFLDKCHISVVFYNSIYAMKERSCRKGRCREPEHG